MVPRQFLEITNGTTEVEDQVSNSSSDERTRSNTPQMRNSNGKTGREDSPESETQGWGPNKSQKILNSSNVADQANTEATMRKARVSVRARSEASMVCIH